MVWQSRCYRCNRPLAIQRMPLRLQSVRSLQSNPIQSKMLLIEIRKFLIELKSNPIELQKKKKKKKKKNDYRNVQRRWWKVPLSWRPWRPWRPWRLTQVPAEVANQDRVDPEFPVPAKRRWPRRLVSVAWPTTGSRRCCCCCCCLRCHRPCCCCCLFGSAPRLLGSWSRSAAAGLKLARRKESNDCYLLYRTSCVSTNGCKYKWRIFHSISLV